MGATHTALRPIAGDVDSVRAQNPTKCLSQDRSMGPRPVKISRNARAGGPCYDVNNELWDRRYVPPHCSLYSNQAAQKGPRNSTFYSLFYAAIRGMATNRRCTARGCKMSGRDRRYELAPQLEPPRPLSSGRIRRGVWFAIRPGSRRKHFGDRAAKAAQELLIGRGLLVVLLRGDFAPIDGAGDVIHEFARADSWGRSCHWAN